jgi:selenocysteine-specific elongation factor
MKSVILGTAGHIDHGKTALVHALTGTDTDRLPEEKRRGITIDLGFAAMRLADSDLRISFIDVPGHHAFVRNMLAGTGGIDAVLLVIAADEGVKEQTREHVAICSLLGIERGLVALTKADAVDRDRLEQTRHGVTEYLAGTFLNAAPVLPVSAKTREGVAELRTELARLAAAIPEQCGDFLTRLAPDRSFSMRGFGTVVTGTLRAGSIRAGATLALQPANRDVRVRGLQVHGEAVTAASAPCRVALNLTGIEPEAIHRGQMLVEPGTLEPAVVIDVEIQLLPDSPPLKHRARVRLHVFTADVGATVLLYEDEKISAGRTALARLQLQEPLVLVPGDRFVLRQSSPAATLGGGRVLDAAPRRGWKKAQTLEWLKRIQDAGREDQLQLRIARRGADGVALAELGRETGLRTEVMQPCLCVLTQRGLIAAREHPPQFVMSAEVLAQIEAAMLGHVLEANNGAIARAELRSRMKLSEAAFAMALGRLLANKKPQGGDVLTRFGRASLVNDAGRQRAAAVERAYAVAGIAPPLLREVADRLRLNPTQTREAITLLVRENRLIRIGTDDLYIHCEAAATLRQRLQQHRGEAFDVARFKTFTGLTRKHAIPLLEYLDRAHVTRNTAGTRTVV